MAGRRTYGDRCGVARALDVVGERWALLVVRELLLGPKRFTDLRTGLPGLSPDILSHRLRELAASGVVRRRRLPPPAGSQVYELTARGQALEPVVLELGRWGAAVPFGPGEPWMSADATLIALKTVFDPGAAGDLSESYELRLGEDRFRAAVTGGRLELARGDGGRPAATLTTDSGTLAALLWQGLPLADARRSGALELEGDEQAAERFLRLFPAPAPEQA
jgi:DNA-binding HxlR family transcriptional regulator